MVRLLATKCEDNKVYFARYQGLELLLAVIEQHGADRNVVCEACGAMRAVTAVDDFRKDFSASHTHTRALVSKVRERGRAFPRRQSSTPSVISIPCQHTMHAMPSSQGAIPLLVGCARRFPADLEVAVAALASLRNLANNDDSVGQIAREGGLELAAGALEQHVGNAVRACIVPLRQAGRFTGWRASWLADWPIAHRIPRSPQALARTVLSVFRNVSADDKLKAQLCASGDGSDTGAAALMLRAMRAHPGDARLQEHALATMAAMALRSPDNCLRLAALGGVPVALQAMRGHPEATAVQRQGSLAVRNLVSRTPELADLFLDAGAEPLLRAAGRFQESVDEAYAALRDLKCEVRRVVVDPATGKARDAVEQFGQARTNFNPCFDTSNDVDGRIAEAAVAPAAGGGYRF